MKTTNIQYPELLSLLSIHFTDDNGRFIEPTFLGSESFKSSLAEIWSTLPRNSPHLDQNALDRISKRIKNVVVIDGYFGTCPAFLPPYLHLDIGSTCGESGYIHSVGEVIVFRNATKLTEEELHSRARQYLKKSNDTSPIFIVPYCHEDFSKSDRNTPFLKDGLDDIKMYISKSSVGSAMLVSALENLENFFQTELHIDAMVAPSGNYKEARDTFIEKFQVKVPRTWFWIMDSDIRMGSKFPDDRKLFVIYEQKFKLENPYHWFDENKPGWVSHTTLPHTLCAAMLNLTRPWWPTDREVHVCDPFGGSGTTYLEAQKFNNVRVYSSDISFFAIQAALDNKLVFSQDHDWLKKISKHLSGLERGIKAGHGLEDSPPRQQVASMIFKLRRIAKDLVSTTGGDCLDVTEEIWSRLAREYPELKSLEFRVALYGFLRGYLRHKVDISRENVSESTAIVKELEGLRDSFDGIMRMTNSYVLDRMGDPRNPQRTNRERSRLDFFGGNYSIATKPSLPLPAVDLFGTPDIIMRSVLDLPLRKFDIVLCDPPYVFNTNEDIVTFERLFTDAIRSIISSISRDGGQVVLALPDISFTGRPIPYFVRPKFAIREFIETAKLLNRRLIRPIAAAPTPLTKFSPPYYWYSEKALKRAILHFWIEPEQEGTHRI